MTTHRVTANDFDLLIAHWHQLRDKTPAGTAKHERILDKLARLEQYRRTEYGPQEAEDELAKLP